MKSLIAIALSTGVFMTMFLTLSLIGVMWGNTYREVLANHTWFFLYSLFIGWWVALIPTIEYVKRNEEYFDTYL